MNHLKILQQILSHFYAFSGFHTPFLFCVISGLPACKVLHFNFSINHSKTSHFHIVTYMFRLCLGYPSCSFKSHSTLFPQMTCVCERSLSRCLEEYVPVIRLNTNANKINATDHALDHDQ